MSDVNATPNKMSMLRQWEEMFFNVAVDVIFFSIFMTNCIFIEFICFTSAQAMVNMKTVDNQLSLSAFWYIRYKKNKYERDNSMQDENTYIPHPKKILYYHVCP